MKKIYSKILLIALCILSLSATAQIPSNQNGEFLSTENYLNDFNKIIIPKCCGETTVPNLIFFYNPFSALTNHDRIELAKEKSLNTWFNQQYQNIKSEIESQLHTTFPNFEEAKNTYFKHWEKKNLLSHANFVKDKYDNRINVRKGKRDKSVRNLKLLELREIELNIGNIDNTSYGSFNFNGTPIGDIRTLSQLNTLRNREMSVFSTNEVTLHNNRGISQFLSIDILNDMGSYANRFNFDYDILNAILPSQNNYFNSYGSWQQLDLMQLYLNNVRIPYVLVVEVRTADFGTAGFLENYAVQHRRGGISVWDNNYYNYLVEGMLGPNETDERAIEAAEYAAELAVEADRQAALNSLLGDVTITDLVVNQLNEDLKADPFKLIEIDCNQIVKWQALAQHNAPQSVLNKIKDLKKNHSTLLGDWNIQYLNEARGSLVNMDFFPVTISTLPKNPETGQQFTADQFLEYIRTHINNFVDTQNSEFAPYSSLGLQQQETALWSSNNPVGSIIKIDIAAFPTIIGDIAGNDGVVVCSESTNNHWNFMTLEAPYDSEHPVSGTRQFGYFLDVNGNYVFYTRGVDRFQSNITQNLAGAYSAVNTGSNNPFFGADALWRSFQQGIANFVNDVNNNGSAVINSPQINRPDWQKVKEVLEGTKPISDLGCN